MLLIFCASIHSDIRISIYKKIFALLPCVVNSGTNLGRKLSPDNIKNRLKIFIKLGIIMLNILVICTGNSCRSVIGEALLNHLGKGRIKAFSAGSQPLGRLNSGALALLQRHRLATEGFASKSWEVYEEQPIDLAITVCDSAAGEICPAFLRTIPKAHWGTADPAHVKETDEAVLGAFENTYRIFEQRINKMLDLPLENMSASAIANELNTIGRLD
jgi:arsenate reductase (thioredoxin)